MRSIAEVINSTMPENGIERGVTASGKTHGPPSLVPRPRPYRQAVSSDPLTDGLVAIKPQPITSSKAPIMMATGQSRPASAKGRSGECPAREMPSLPRSVSAGIPRPCRPPTPEYAIPQDCAFPPFPGFNQGIRHHLAPLATPIREQLSTATRSVTTPRAPTSTSSSPSASSPLEAPKRSEARPGFFRRLFSSPKQPTKKLTQSASQLDLATELAALSTCEAELLPRLETKAGQSDAVTPNTEDLQHASPQQQSSGSGAEPIETAFEKRDLADFPVTPAKSSLRLQTHELPPNAPQVPARSPLRAPTAKRARQYIDAQVIDSPTSSDDASKLECYSQCLPVVVLPSPTSLRGDCLERRSHVSSDGHSCTSPSSHSSPASRSSISDDDSQDSISTARTSHEISPYTSKEDLLAAPTPSQGATAGISMASLAASLRDIRTLSFIEHEGQSPEDLSLPSLPPSPPASLPPRQARPRAPTLSPSKTTTGLLLRPPLTTRLTNNTSLHPQTTCRGCSSPITGRAVKAADGRLTGRYHKACFVCKTCATLMASTCYVLDDEPYCALHYHEKNGSLCEGCRKGIEGRYLEMEAEMGLGVGEGERTGRMWHVECFECVDCGERLTERYWDVEGRVYCEQDAERVVAEMGEGMEKAERRKTRILDF